MAYGGIGERIGHDSAVVLAGSGMMVMTCARSRRVAREGEIRWIIDLASHKRARVSDQVV